MIRSLFEISHGKIFVMCAYTKLICFNNFNKMLTNNKKIKKIGRWWLWHVLGYILTYLHNLLLFRHSHSVTLKLRFLFIHFLSIPWHQSRSNLIIMSILLFLRGHGLYMSEAWPRFGKYNNKSFFFFFVSFFDIYNKKYFCIK